MDNEGKEKTQKLLREKKKAWEIPMKFKTSEVKSWKLVLKLDQREKRANQEYLNLKYFEEIFTQHEVPYDKASLSLGDFSFTC